MIQLPRDAEGREIPLDTSELFIADGTKVRALRFEYMYHTSDARDAWFVYIERTPGEHMTLHACDVHLIQPDSWEKLEDDIRRIGTDDCTWFCGYANENPVENACPDSCKFFKGDEITCRKKLADDILSRIRKLRGEDDA